VSNGVTGGVSDAEGNGSPKGDSGSADGNGSAKNGSADGNGDVGIASGAGGAGGSTGTSTAISNGSGAPRSCRPSTLRRAATLPANYTFTEADNGVHTFTAGVTLETAGEQSVTATDVAVGTITGIHDWDEFIEKVGALLAAPTRREAAAAAARENAADAREGT